MSTVPLEDEAIAILDAEATRRIEEIQQSIEFICSSLRAQGNMTINQLLQSVRSLTMDEYCNKYRADTTYFLEEQARQRKETTMVTPGKTPGKKRSHRDQSDALENDKPLSKKKQSSLKHKETENIRTPTATMLSKSSLTTSVNPTTDHHNQNSQQRPYNSHSTNVSKIQRKHHGEDEEEINFGPLFMQFLRPGQPKVTFQFDPQEELDENTASQLQVPYELVDQFGSGHRRRIVDQVQHIQDQLELFKERLLEPPSVRLSSSPSPSL